MWFCVVRWIANAQLPILAASPEEERQSFHLADPDLQIELVAAEPNVLSPVALAWDAAGRMFVAEMMDYPLAATGGQIRMLEDADGDGRYERATVFADHLKFPNGVLPWRDGVLVTSAPDILFLRDTDANGRADSREVLFTGFAEGNQQLRVNGLIWGLDNWICGANGRSDGEMRRPNQSPGEALSLRAHDFRFDPFTLKFETIAGRSQFGSARDDWGGRFLSWNTIPIRHEVIPERYLIRTPNLPGTESLQDLLPAGDDGRVFPLAAPPLTFNSESVRHFNALAGLTIYRGGALGERYRGNAFAGETLLSLVHRRVLEAAGPTFVARRGETKQEFLASTDSWFHPVFFATGPDGALYIADFYRRFVEHPGYVADSVAREKMPWREGAEHGRIWRIARKDFSRKPPGVPLSRRSTVDLARCLEDSNGWIRDTAQRLLVERRDKSVAAALEELVQNANLPAARLQALWTLAGLESLRPAFIEHAMTNSEPVVRAHAIRLAEPLLKLGGEQSESMLRRLAGLARDPDPRVRFQLALSLGEAGSIGDALRLKFKSLAALATIDATNDWHALAILSSVRNRPWLLLEEIRSGLGAQSQPAPAKFFERLGFLVGANSSEADLTDCLAWLKSGRTSVSMVVVAGIEEGLMQSGKTRLAAADPRFWERLSDEADRTAMAAEEPAVYRVAAIKLLAGNGPAAPKLFGLLNSAEPPPVQTAAVNTLLKSRDEETIGRVFRAWNGLAKSTRRNLLAASGRNVTAQLALLSALDRGDLSVPEVDPVSRQALAKSSDASVRARFDKIFPQSGASDRESVIREFQPALKLAGDRRRGAEIFSRTCLTCHAIGNRGSRVGADLSAVTSRSKEALLLDILDPSRVISPDFLSYTAMTREGEAVTGIIVAETETFVRLRAGGGFETTIPRAQIETLRADGKSLMPDGLEQGMSLQGMADLLEFVKNSAGELLPE